jgi:16S rRNA (uracil1498-N3)-methyltransferase
MARHVPHLYLPGRWDGELIGVEEAIRQHLEKVLRRGAPSPVTYTDGVGRVGRGVYDRGFVRRGEEHSVARPGRIINIAVAPPKNKGRIRFIVEKLAELGVDRLIWLETSRSEGRSPRREKSRAWARAALEQSQGAWLLEVVGPVLLSEVSQYGTPVFADRSGMEVAAIDDIVDPVLCVGPEGGFEAAEIPTDVIKVRLSPQLLRVETAAVVGAVLLGS